MTSPHAPYGPPAGPQPGPSYGPPPPSLHYGYTGPAQFYPPYHMPPMNGHPPLHPPPPPASPRVHGPGRGRYNARGAAPPFYPSVLPPPHLPMPPTVVPTPPPVSPASPYHHPQKYQHQIPYVSPYHPPQPSGPYPHTWTGQTLSPLPKQLTMLPPMLSTEPPPGQLPNQHPSPQPHSLPEPPVISSRMFERAPSPLVSQVAQQVHSPPPPPAPHIDVPQVDVPQETIPEVEHPHPVSDMIPVQQTEPESSSSESSQRQEDEQTKLSEQLDASNEPPSNKTEFTAPGTPSSAPTQLTSLSSTYVIWSRRPSDPTSAPGVIISHHAFPPNDVLQKALEIPSPPSSPKVEQTMDLASPLYHDLQDRDEEPTTAPSSSTTETTPACSIAAGTPVPGSPFSSATSVSAAATGSPSTKAVVSPRDKKIELPPAAVEPLTAEPSTPQPVVEQTPSSPPPSSKTIAAPKKSWASILQSSDPTASSSKSRLPVSNVVGFSVPAASASAVTSSPGPSIATSNRNELLHLLTDGPSGSSAGLASMMKIRPRGLVNTGNMCFANAVLQILVYCAPFHRFFAELRRHLTGPVVGSQREGTKATPLVDATIQFLKEFVPDPPATVPDSRAKGKERDDDSFDELDSFIPTYVYDAMKEKKRFANMIGGHQEDAEEFLGFFLDTLEEELLSISLTLQSKDPAKPDAEEPTQEDGWMEVGKKNKAVVTRTAKTTDSPITRIFGGKFRSTLRTPHQRDSATIEDWRSLQLDIQPENVKSLRDALQHISHPQPVQITIPTKPGALLDASQQVLIEALPPVLILHMKRFLYDTQVGDVVKVSKQVSFSSELDIPPEIVSPTKRTAQPVKYQLFGVLYHHGPSASGGHYTLDVLHPNRELSDRPRAAWIRIDDELVSDVRPEDVFGGQEREDRQPYLLFYRKMTAWGQTRTN